MASVIQGDKKELISKFKSDPQFREEVLKEAKEILSSKIEDHRQNLDPSFNQDFAKQNLSKLAEYSDAILNQQKKESKGFFSKVAIRLFGVDETKIIEKSRDMSGIFEAISSAHESLSKKSKSQESYSRVRSNSESERAPLPLSELENDEKKPSLKRQETLYSDFPQIIQGPENERRPQSLKDLGNEKSRPSLQRQEAKLDLKSSLKEQKPSVGKFTENLNSERDVKQTSKNNMSIG